MHLSPIIVNATPLKSVRQLNTLRAAKPHKFFDGSLSIDARKHKRKIGATSFNAIFSIEVDEFAFDVGELSHTRGYSIYEGVEEHLLNTVSKLDIDDILGTKKRPSKGFVVRNYVNVENLRCAFDYAKALGDRYGMSYLLEYASEIHDGIHYSVYDASKCRLVETTSGMQMMSKIYRGIILDGSGAADVDVANSVPADLPEKLREWGASDDIVEIFQWYADNKQEIMDHFGLTKQQYIALVFGQQQERALLIEIQELLRGTVEKHMEDEGLISTLPLPNGHQLPWNKYLSNQLFEMEKEKVFVLSYIFADMGYDTRTFCFDGLILSSSPNQDEIAAAEELYEAYAERPISLKIKQVF